MSAMCAAKGCHFMPSAGSLFCYLHPTPIQRMGVVAAHFDDTEDWPWSVEAPMATPKLVVKWDKEKFQYVATRPDTEVTGYSDVSPGGAIRDWQRWWDECPF